MSSDYIPGLVSKQASQWRDLSATERKLEQGAKVALIAGGVLLLIGTVVGCYAASQIPSYYTFTSYYDMWWGEYMWNIIEVNNAPIFVTLIATYGGIGTAAAFFWGIMLGRRETPDAANPKYKARVERILQGSFKTFMNERVGLEGLVRTGAFTPKQGEQIRELRKEYQECQRTLCELQTQPLFRARGGDAYKESHLYKAQEQRLKSIEIRWEQLLMDRTPPTDLQGNHAWTDGRSQNPVAFTMEPLGG